MKQYGAASLTACLLYIAVSAVIAQPVPSLPSNANCDLRGVLKATFGPKTGKRLEINLEYGEPNDWSFHIADSATNDGWGAGTWGLLHSNGNYVTAKGRVTINVSDGKVTADNGSESIYVQSYRTMALNGQPDSQGPVNNDIYIGLNQVVRRCNNNNNNNVNDDDNKDDNNDNNGDNNGDNNDNNIDDNNGVNNNDNILDENNNDNSNDDNIDENNDNNDDNIDGNNGDDNGDNNNNEDDKNDNTTQHNTTQHNTTQHVVSKSSPLGSENGVGTPAGAGTWGLLHSNGNYVTAKGRVTINVSDGKVTADNGSESIYVQSYRTMALNGQPDSQGPVNNDIYIGLNQVVRRLLNGAVEACRRVPHQRLDVKLGWRRDSNRMVCDCGTRCRSTKTTWWRLKRDHKVNDGNGG
nr:hypothetical protein BaRGS_005155 [Batillaria attramentaria]